MTDSIERAILNVGKHCKFVSGDNIIGQITSVKATDAHYLYECGWFANGTYYVGTFEEFEIEVVDE